jgi:hypothetical protein
MFTIGMPKIKAAPQPGQASTKEVKNPAYLYI